MRKVNQFLTEYRVILGLIAVLGVIFTYIKFPARLTAVEEKNVVQDEEIDENEDAVQKLGFTVDKYIAVQAVREETDKEQKKILLDLLMEQRKANNK